MDNLKRQNQISETDLKSFKEQEINKILLKIDEKSPRKISYRLVMTLSVFIVALVSLSFILFGNNGEDLKDFNLQTLSNNSYLIEKDTDEFNLKFYYFANVFKEGFRTSYNDTYDYFSPYEYVSDEIIEQFEVDFNAFQIDGYRYFLEVIVNGSSSYIQINFATDYDPDIELTELEIENYKNDIEEIYNWIDLYPPVFLFGNQNKPIYDINPEIDDLDDSRAKRNYITYVRNYYIPNNPITEENPKNYLTISTNQVILVDGSGNFTGSHFDTLWCFGTCSIDDIHSIFTDLTSMFKFYLKGSDELLGYTGMPMESMSSNKANGQIREMSFGNPFTDPDNFYKDMYLIFEEIQGVEDLSIIKSAEVSLHFNEAYGGNTEDHIIDAFYYNNSLITSPFFSTNQEDMTGGIVYDSITVTLKDSNNEIIKVITFDFALL